MGKKLEHLRHGRLIGNGSNSSCMKTDLGGAQTGKSRETDCSYDPLQTQLEEMVS